MGWHWGNLICKYGWNSKVLKKELELQYRQVRPTVTEKAAHEMSNRILSKVQYQSTVSDKFNHVPLSYFSPWFDKTAYTFEMAKAHKS